MKLEIITPDRIVFAGDVSLVTVPGSKGSFTLLDSHAPIISSLGKGELLYRINGIDNKIIVSGGFVEVHNNLVSIAIEEINE